MIIPEATMFFLSDMLKKKTDMPAPENALRGRSEPIPTASQHAVFGTPLKGPYPEGAEIAYFGMGCFWGAERLFWQTHGVIATAVGYAGGHTPNPDLSRDDDRPDRPCGDRQGGLRPADHRL